MIIDELMEASRRTETRRVDRELMRAAAEEIHRLNGEILKANDALAYCAEKLGVDLAPNAEPIPSIHQN